MTTTNSRIPVAFAAPAQQYLYENYGDPRIAGWENRWMMLWQVRKDFPWFPQEKMYLHKDFQPLLKKAFDALTANGCYHEIKTFDGCFNIRHVRGGYSVLSIHSWGAAIDLNARDNPIATAGKWSKAFIDTMKQCGIYCGQTWTGRKDPMHFAMING